MTVDPRIFVSYSSKDRDYAVAQRERIAAQGLTLWQDFANLEGGNAGGWWDQIRERLENRATEHMVLFVSVDALVSGVVADEWRYARRQGVEVHLIKVPDKLRGQDIALLPAGMSTQHFYNLEIPEQFDRLIAALKGPSRQHRVPTMAPAPDEHFVLRNEEADKLIAALLRNLDAADTEAGSNRGRAVGITAALRGAGGYGKTQLARWLCHQERLVDHFFDGILWVELGENPDQTGGLQGKVEFLIAQLRRTLTDEDRGFPNATAAAKRLFELLEKGSSRGKGRYLLVIDDAWRKSDVDLFMGGAPDTVRLIATRIDDTLPVAADKIPVDAMKPAEAVELLAIGLDRLGITVDDIASNRAAFTHLAGRLGEWALLLALANGQLRAEVEAGLPLAEAIRFVERIYDEMGLVAFDPQDETQRTRAATLSIGASLGRLSNVEVSRFEDLAIFPEDEHIPTATITRLWAHTSSGEVTELIGAQLLRKLRRFALLQSLDLGLGTARLHDVMRKYLRDRVEASGLVGRHRAWLTANAEIDAKALAGPEQLYYYNRRPLHLSEAGELEALDTLLTDVAWMQDKIAAFASPLPLIEDYRAYAAYDPANKNAAALVGRALEQSAGALGRDERQLVPHLLGRLRPDMAAGVDGVLTQARRALKPPAIVPRFHGLRRADSPLIRTMEGHSHGYALGTFPDVLALAFSQDGDYLVSGSADGTLLLWNPYVGEKIGGRFLGHEDIVRAVCFSPNGNIIASASHDTTVRLWDSRTRTCKTLKGHRDFVLTVAFSRDGTKLLSGSGDKSILIWDAQTGLEVSDPLIGHEGAITSLAISPTDGLCVSGSSDGTLRLWDIRTSLPVGPPFVGHGNTIRQVSFFPCGERVASCSDDGTIRIWAIKTAKQITAPLVGHNEKIKGLAIAPDGSRIISASMDNKLRLWDPARGVQIMESMAHGDLPASALAWAPNGAWVVTGCMDGKLRVWDSKFGFFDEAVSGSQKIDAIACSPDGSKVAISRKRGAIQYLNPQAAGSPGEAIPCHSESINAIAFSPDSRRLATGSDDKTLRLWDAATGEPIGDPLKGHDHCVYRLAFSPDGSRIVSGSFDTTLRLWDADRGLEIGTTGRLERWVAKFFGVIGHKAGSRISARFCGHADWVTALAISPDGCHLVSGADVLRGENRLRLWGMSSGAQSDSIWHLHSGRISALAFSPDSSQILSGSFDHTLSVWSTATGERICAIAGHGKPVIGGAFSPGGSCVLSGSNDKTIRLWCVNTTVELARFENDDEFDVLAVAGKFLAAGDRTGRVLILDIILDEADKAHWLARFDATSPSPPPADIASAPPEMQVTTAHLAGARHLETYRDRHIFALADGRVYLDGLIAVSSVEHARATLDQMARQDRGA